MSRRLRRFAGFTVEREAVRHGLEIAAGIDKGDAKRFDADFRCQPKKTRAHIAAGDIRLDDDIIAIGRKHPAAELQCVAEITGARIRPDADLGA